MKVGDLVRLKEGRALGVREKDIYYHVGVIIVIKEYAASGLWYKVQWGQENLWHHKGDLELISEP